MQRMHKKGQLWISVLLYTLIAAVAVIFILEAGTPLIEGMRDRSVFTKTKSQLLNLDQQIQEVAQGGKGTSRTVAIEIDRGNLHIENNQLRYELETASEIVEEGSSQRVGNLLISADSNVKAYSNSTNYILENNRIIVSLFKGGSSNLNVAINTSNLIESVYIIDENKTITPQFSFVAAGDATTKTGNGYSKLIETGTYLGSGTYRVYIDSTSYTYEIDIILESNADFIKSKIRNFQVK